MSADPLGLLDYLFGALGCVEPEERGRSHWVMDGEWLLEILKLTDSGGRPLWVPSWSLDAPQRLLGLPIEIRKGSGAPHLELTDRVGVCAGE